MDNSLFSLDSLGLTPTATDTGDPFSLASLGLDHETRRAMRFENSIVRPRDGESVLAYIDRVFDILDGYGHADRRADANRGIRPIARPAPGMPPAPTRTVVRRPLERDDHDVDYILDGLNRAIARIGRKAREDAAKRAARPAGNGSAIGGSSKPMLGVITDANRIDRIITRMRHEIVKRATLSGHARAPFTRSIRQDARTLIARHGLSIEDIVDRLNDGD